MRYLGGKTRIGGKIAAFLNSVRLPGQMYYEPFVGACGVFAHMGNPRVGSDISADIILMLKALQKGWTPPSVVTKDLYRQLGKASPSALRAFAGFGCSFSGNWFSGYADSYGRDFAAEARNSLVRLRPKLQGAEFICQDYRQCALSEQSLVYCDPPYPYNIGYTAAGELDLSVFYATIREWSTQHTVILSGYSAPDDFMTLWEIPTWSGTGIGDGKKRRVEKLFTLVQ